MRSRARVRTRSRSSRCSSSRPSQGTWTSLVAVVADGLDVVAVRVEDVRAVVVLPVLRSRPRRPVVAVAGLGQGMPEGIDTVARGCDEAGVQAPRSVVLGVGLGDGEVVPLEELLAHERPACELD